MNNFEPCFIKCRICEQYSFIKYPHRGYCSPCDYEEIYCTRRDASDGLYVDPYEDRDNETALEEFQLCA
jgi:hypothetical protein